MALPQWPALVGACPLLDTMQVQQTADAPIRTEMNAGTTRARRKFTLRIARVTFSLRMTNAQVIAFRAFHEDTLSDGAARFQMPILFAGIRRNETAQFAEQPSYDSLGAKLTRVTISLRIENLGSGTIIEPTTPTPTPSGSIFLLPDGSGFLLPDGSSHLLLPGGTTTPSSSSFLLPDGSDFLLPDGSSHLLLPTSSTPSLDAFLLPSGSAFLLPDGSSNLLLP